MKIGFDLEAAEQTALEQVQACREAQRTSALNLLDAEPSLTMMQELNRACDLLWLDDAGNPGRESLAEVEGTKETWAKRNPITFC